MWLHGIVIWVWLSVIHLVEAKLEGYVIALKNPYIPKYTSWNHKEHFWSAVLAATWFSFAASGAAYFHCYWLIPALLVNRRIFFDYGLILFEEWDRKSYTGNDWWKTKFFMPVFGKNGRQKELVLTVLITAASIYFTIAN